MSLKPVKKSDLGKTWMNPRKGKRILIQPEYHLIVTEGTKTEPNYFKTLQDTMRKGSLSFKRTIYYDVKKSIEDNSVTFILGARKTGKTVCVKQLRDTYRETNVFDEVIYVDLKLCDDKESFIDDVIDSICKDKNALILIDETTYLHNADRVICSIGAAYAETVNHNTRIVFAGSQSLALDSWGHSAFAGNAAFITADFLTYPEWLAYKGISEVSEETYAQFVLGTRDFYTYFTSVKDYLQGCLDETIRSNHNAAEKIYGNDCSLVTVEMLLDVLYASLITLHGEVSHKMDVFLEERYKSLKAMDADELKQSLQFLYNCGLITITYVTDDLNISPYFCTNLLSPFNDNFQQKYTKSSLMERLNICIAYPMFYVELLHDVLQTEMPDKLPAPLLGSVVECHVRGLLPRTGCLEYHDMQQREIDYVNTSTSQAVEITISNKKMPKTHFDVLPEDYCLTLLTKDRFEQVGDIAMIPYYHFTFDNSAGVELVKAPVYKNSVKKESSFGNR